jgi:hypothetical protein
MDHSLRLGRSVLRELGTVNTLHKPHVEQASFAVLKAPDVPSILVETAFISNPEEEKRLNDHAYQDRLARALLAGIRQYIAKHPPRAHGPLAQAGDPRSYRSTGRSTEGCAGERRCLSQAMIPGEIESSTMPRMTSVRLFFTHGRLPKK